MLATPTRTVATPPELTPEAAAPEAAAIEQLVARAQHGDCEAFAGLYDRYQPELIRYLFHRTGDQETAADLVQQVFLKAWQALPRYEQRGIPIKAWLYRMAHNQMVDHLRRRRQVADLDGIEIADTADTARFVEHQELHDELMSALGQLTEAHRQVLVLRFLMEKSAREVGEIMGRTEVNVRGLQFRALAALREVWAARAA